MPSRARGVNFAAVSTPRRAAWWPALLLIPLCAALYLPGLFAIPPVDRDEARYAQATRQMLASGDFVIPRLQSQPRLIKPAAIYWLQAAAVRIAGTPGEIAAYRLPSAIGALLAVLGTFWIGRLLCAGATACLAAALLASSALLVVQAHLATTDSVLLACIVAAQACIASLYVRRPRRAGDAATRSSGATALAFWSALAIGVLVKGPVAPLVAGLTVIALWLTDRPAGRRLLADLRPLWGMPLAAGLIAPWVVAVGLRIGWAALPAAMLGDILPKLSGGHESHGAPPGLYLLIAPATFWPASLLLAFALAMGWRRRRRRAERFLLAWLVPAWLVFELLPTKLPNYVLPTFPALALLAARAALGAPALLRPALRAPFTRALLIAWVLLTLAFGALPMFAALRFAGDAARGFAAICALAAAALGCLCLREMWRGTPPRALWLAVLASALFYAPLLHGVLPRLEALWLSDSAAAAVARAGAERPLASAGYAEPSLVFMTRSDIALLDGSDAAEFIAAHPRALALVAGDQLSAFIDGAAQRGVRVRNLWSTRGINYSRGETTTLHLFENPATAVSE